jgi:tetratricopeptide (TPR) repeat protein
MLHCLRGECDVFDGDPTSAVARARIGLEIASRYPGTWGLGYCLWNAGYANLAAGDDDTAIALFTEEIQLARAHGYGIGEMVGCNVLGETWEARGDLDAARACLERALHLRREVGAAAIPTLMTALPIGHSHGTMPTALLAVARVADKQGDHLNAAARLREALPLAEERREVTTAQQIVELLRKTTQDEPTQRATLRPENGVWRIEFKGANAHVPDLKGLWHLRELVARPHELVPALTLIGASSDEPIPTGDSGPVLDREAIRQYRRRLAELDDELDTAVVRGDVAGQEQRSAERDALISELKRATGLGGRPRRSGSPAEKARLNVTRTIRHAIADLSPRLPGLAAHFDESIVTGLSCCYQPLTNIVWTT